jgi:hypothetical protein
MSHRGVWLDLDIGFVFCEALDQDLGFVLHCRRGGRSYIAGKRCGW